MPEVKHPALAHDHEPGAVNDIGFAFEQWSQQPRVFAGIVLQVGILDDRIISARLLDGSADGRSLALVTALSQEADFRMLAYQFRYDVGGPVR